jgi:hypothetical protein
VSSRQPGWPLAQMHDAPGAVPFLGVNYHTSATGTAMWREWDRAAVAADFAAMAANGFDAVRLFLYWRDFQPAEDTVSAEMLTRAREAAQEARANGLSCVLSAFTIWMNGERLEPAWRRGRSLWHDIALLAAQERYLAALAEAVADCGSVVAIDLGDEIANADPVHAAIVTTAELTAWYERMRGAVQQVAPAIGVCQANDASAVFGSGAFNVGNSTPLDLAAVHGFPTWSRGSIESYLSSKATHLPAFLTRVAGAYRPAIIDELGCYGTSEATAARYLPAAAASALANGANGVVVWCWQDIASTQEPFNDRPLERFAGLHRINGDAKPAMDALRTLLTRRPELRPESPAATAIYLPERMWPHAGSYLDTASGALGTFYAYLLLKQVHVAFDVVASGLDGYALVVCPTVGHLTATDLERLTGHVKAGGTLYLSLGDSLHGFPGGDLAGAEPVDFTLLTQGRTSMTWESDRWPVGWPEGAPAVVLDPGRATVVATFADGTPAVTRNAVGRGQVVLCAAPYEAQIDGPGRLAAHPWHRLYQRVVRLAGVAPLVRCDQPSVEVVRVRGQGRPALFVLNHAPTDVRTTLRLDGTSITLDLAGKQWTIIADREDG